MSKEPLPSIWNFESLYVLLCQKIDDNDRRYEQRHQHNIREQESKERAQQQERNADISAMREAVGKAEAANDRRFEQINEFRSAMLDQAAHYVTRAEFEAKHNEGSSRITRNDGRIDKIEASGAGKIQLWGWLIGGLATIAVIVELLLRLRG